MGRELSLKTSSFEYFIWSNTYDLIIARVNELHRGVGEGEATATGENLTNQPTSLSWQSPYCPICRFSAPIQLLL